MKMMFTHKLISNVILYDVDLLSELKKLISMNLFLKIEKEMVRNE